MRFLASFLVLLWLPVAAFAQDDDDAGFLTRLLQDALSGAGRDVQIRGFEGALSSNATIESLVISDENGEWLRAEGLSLVWSRLKLIRGILDVNELTAQSIVVSRKPVSEPKPPSAEATPFQIPELPVTVLVEDLAIASVALGEDVLGEAAEFTVKGAARLEDGAADIQFALDRIDGEVAQIALTASYDPEARNLVVDFAAEEDAGGLVGQLAKIPGQPSLSVTVEGEGNVEDFAADIALTTNNEPRVSGTVAILSPASDDSWDVRVDLTGDPTPLLEPDMQEFFGTNIGIKARVLRDAAGAIDLTDLDLTAQSLALNGTARLDANGWPEEIDVTGEMAHPDGRPVVLPFGDGSTQVGDVTFELLYDDDLRFDAEMTAFENPAATLDRLVLTGRGDIQARNFASDGVLDMDITLDAENIAMADPKLARAVGRALTGEARVDYRSGQPVHLTGLDLRGEDYGLTGDASFDRTADIPLAMDLRVSAQDIARFSDVAGRDLSGRIDVDVEGAIGPLSGTFDLVIDGTTLDLAVDQEVADRVLAGVGSARVDARRDETGTTIRQLRVVTAGANLEAAGRISTDQTAVNFGGELRNLGVLWPDEAEGRAEMTGSVSLSGTQLGRLELSADLSNLTGPVVLPFANGMTLTNGTVEAIATGGPDGSWTIDAQSRDLQTELASAQSLDLSGSGALSQSESGSLVSASGALATDTLGLRIADPDLAQALGSAPTIQAEFDWSLDGERLALQRFAVDTGVLDMSGSALVVDTLTQPDAQFALSVVADSFAPLSGLANQSLSGRGQVDVTGTYVQNGAFDVTVDGEASGLDIGNPTLNQLLVGTTEIDANVAGTAQELQRISASVANPELSAQVSGTLDDLQVDARLRDLALLAPDFPGSAQVDGTIAQQNNAFQVDLDILGPGGSRLDVDGSIASGDTTNLSITGDAPLGLANAFIEPRRLNGRANIDVAIQGPLGLPGLSGGVSFTNAELSAPTLGIVLDPINGQLQFQNSAVNIDMAAQGNHGGTLDVSGQLALNTLETNASVTVTAFGIQDPALYDTSVDGTVTVTGALGQGLLVVGDMRLNRTELKVPSPSAFSFGDIPDIEHLGATRPVMRTIERAGLNEDKDDNAGRSGPSTTRLDITISAPDQVFVRGRGLDAELGGDLRLTGPTSNIIPDGGFELLRGRLDILTQRLELEEGRIEISGSFIPVLYFLATADANDITVQIEIDGPADGPDITFSSDPELPEDEVLSQLLFGRNISELSPLQALELANAVATLAGGGVGGVLSSIRDGFGLDDLDLTQSEDGNAAVRAGKYISDNVYTDVVLESGGNTELNINLDVTSEITARGSVNNDGNSSVGIFFERDY